MLRSIIHKIANGVIVLTPFVLMLLPIDFFDTGESICLSKRIFQIECYACGMTKAIMHLIHLDYNSAWSYNKLSFIVLPMLFPLWLKALFDLRGKKLPGLLGRLT